MNPSPLITPPGTTSDDSAFRSLIRTMGLLERVMHPYFAQLGISGSQWGVLRVLHKAALEGNTSLRLSDVGKRLLIRPPSVTGVIDRLTRLGLVACQKSPDDLRAKLVSLTPQGAKIVQRVLAVHPAQIDRVLGGLTTDEQDQLQQLLGRLDRHLETLVEGDTGNSP